MIVPATTANPSTSASAARAGMRVYVSGLCVSTLDSEDVCGTPSVRASVHDPVSAELFALELILSPRGLAQTE